MWINLQKTADTPENKLNFDKKIIKLFLLDIILKNKVLR